jgi:hypothetical protein
MKFPRLYETRRPVTVTTSVYCDAKWFSLVNSNDSKEYAVSISRVGLSADSTVEIGTHTDHRQSEDIVNVQGSVKNGTQAKIVLKHRIYLEEK